MQVEIKQLPELRVAAVRHVGPYNEIAEAFARVGQIAGRAGLFGGTAPQMVALYHDGPDAKSPGELTSDAGLVIGDDVPVPQGLEEHRIAAGQYASTVHTGGYERLGDTWARFMGEWIPASGKRVADGPSYEVYLNNPMEVKKEALKTEIRVPVTD